MATSRQTIAAKKNIKKAQRAWQDMTPRARALAQPQGRSRSKPGATGRGKFYRIEVRPKAQFTSFRTQDVGKKGGLERIAGRRSSGSWDTATWLVAKTDAHVTPQRTLVIDDSKAKTMLENIRGPITWMKGDIFIAHPRKNVPEHAKPTPRMRRAQRENIIKAQQARKKSVPV